MTTASRSNLGLGAGGAATPEAPHEERLGLRARALAGSAWTIGGYIASQGIRLGANLVLQRLLFPEIFGIMAVVSVIQQGLAMFSDVGIGPSIIQSKRGEEPVFLRTAWTIQVVRGFTLWLFMMAMAIPVSLVVGVPQLSTVLPVAGLGGLVGGFNSTRLFTRNRRMALGRLTLLNIVSQIASTGVIIVWARYSPTVWAPVAGGLVASMITLVWSHLLPGDHRDGFGLDRDCLRELIGFGRWIFVSTVVSFLTAQGDKLIFAPLIPIGVLGVYSTASVLATTPSAAIFSLTGAVLFPIFSRRVGSGEGLAGIFHRARAPVCVLCAVLVAGLVACGPTFVHLLFDRRFTDADWMVRLLSIAGLFQVLEGINGAALLATGRSKSVAAYSGAKLAGMIILIPLGYYWRGFEGAVTGLVASELFKYAGSVVLVGRIGLKVVRMDLAIMVWVAATAGLGIACGRWTAQAGAPVWLRFLVEGCVVTGLWMPVAWRLWRDTHCPLPRMGTG